MKTFLRTLTLLALLASPALADLRAITGDLDDALGEPANGTMVISWPAYTSVGGVFKPPSRRVISVSEGTYTAFSLDSSQDASPAFSYTVQYNFGAAPPARACSWSIAAGSSSVAITSIQTCPASPSSPASSIGYTTITGLTAGAVTFGGSGGALTQDATHFYWDETNNRLGIGTTSFGGITEKIRATGSASVDASLVAPNGNFYAALNLYSGNGNSTGDNAVVVYNEGSTARWHLAGVWNGSPDFRLIDSDDTFATRVLVGATTGNVLIGTDPVDGNYRFDVQKSGSTGTARFYDQTASTGATLVDFVPGAGQSSTSLARFYNSGSVLNSAFSGTGAFVSFASDVAKIIISTGGQRFASNAGMEWRDNTDANSGSADLGLYRNAAGILEVDNGTPGTYRDARLRNLILTSTAAIDTTLANSQCSMHLTSNTNFQIRCKGSDATVRFADITLAP